MENATNIKCPNCGESIDVQDILANQLKEELNKKYQSQLTEEKEKYKTKVENLNKDKDAFEKEKKDNEDLFNKKLEVKIEEKKKSYEDKIRNRISKENEEEVKELNKELNEKSEKLKELSKSKAEIEKLKREKAEIEEVTKIEAEKRITKELKLKKIEIEKRVKEENEFEVMGLKTQLNQQKKSADEMKRRLEQGSMQLQGEVQELGIEGWLKEKFPSDTIQEIKKGAKGGDCLHIVNNGLEIDCGTIYYESKRAKNFQVGWIEKFKKDIQNKKADIGILVTQVMPSDMDRMGMKEGIWICTYDEFKSLCGVLRESLIQINTIKNNQEDKGDKVHLLYDFLASNEFKMQIDAIVEGFSGMQIGLDSEKRAMQKIWKQREKQIGKVIENTVDMYGAIRGIGGNAIQKVKRLELGYDGKSNN